MRIKEEIVDNIVVLHLKGNLTDVPDTTKLKEKIHSLIGEDFKNVIIDLGDVKWINSSGLGSLVAAFTSVRNTGGDLRLANVTKKIESLFVITQLVRVFKTYETVPRAVASFKSKG